MRPIPAMRSIVVSLVIPLFCCRHFGCFWVLKPKFNLVLSNPKMGLSTVQKKLCLKGKMSNLDAKKLGKGRQQERWFHFHVCTRGGDPKERGRWLRSRILKSTTKDLETRHVPKHLWECSPWGEELNELVRIGGLARCLCIF